MTEEQQTGSRTAIRLKWINVAAAATLLVGLVAAATTGVASAQTVIEGAETASTEQVERSRVLQGDERSEGDEFDEFDELSTDDEAVLDRYDDCLVDAGIDLDTTFELEEAAVDLDAWDAAFEQCDPLLDELNEAFAESFAGEFEVLTPADEALFEEYDQCLENGGIETLFEGDAIDEAAIEALFEDCERVLDGLSLEAQTFFEDCPDDDYADEGEVPAAD